MARKKPGNEVEVVDYLIRNKGLLHLKHLGLVNKIENPGQNGELIEISSTEILRTEAAGKKADIYINGQGVSIKQAGDTFLFNRLQRAEMLEVFSSRRLTNPTSNLAKIDKLIINFHEGRCSRDRHFTEAFNTNDFYQLLKYLMMQGSPNLGKSDYPANYILTAPSCNINSTNISCLTFDEYFKLYSSNIFISLRRQWVGQSSSTEHTRATGLAAKSENLPWVFKTISGNPRTGWLSETVFPKSSRKTVYMTFITVKP